MTRKILMFCFFFNQTTDNSIVFCLFFLLLQQGCQLLILSWSEIGLSKFGGEFGRIGASSYCQNSEDGEKDTQEELLLCKTQ